MCILSPCMTILYFLIELIHFCSCAEINMKLTRACNNYILAKVFIGFLCLLGCIRTIYHINYLQNSNLLAHNEKLIRHKRALNEFLWANHLMSHNQMITWGSIFGSLYFASLYQLMLLLCHLITVRMERILNFPSK